MKKKMKNAIQIKYLLKSSISQKYATFFIYFIDIIIESIYNMNISSCRDFQKYN